MNKYPILTFIGVLSVIIGLIMLAVNWDQVWAWLKSFSSTAPTQNARTSTGNTSSAGARSTNNSSSDKKIICEYVNNRGEVIRTEGYGQAFEQECRLRTQQDYLYQNNYAYYPYRWSYYTYPNNYYWYPWSNNFGITSGGVII